MKKNFIIGSVNWKSPTEANKKKSNDFFSNDFLNITVNRINKSTNKEDYYLFDEKNKIYCTVLGYISNLEEIRSFYSLKAISEIGIVMEFYIQKGLTHFNKLDGVFMIFLFDQHKKLAYIYQPFHGMSLPIYYFSNNEKFIFSTNLKSILLLHNERELNTDAARDFLHFHELIPNKYTLIKNVNKIIPGSFLVVDQKNRKTEQKRIDQIFNNISKEYAKNNLINSLKVSFNNTLKLFFRENYAITHTKGWDTNLLLFFANMISKDTIQTVTINGGEKVNEVPYVKEIQKNYPDIRSIVGNVKGDIINQLVDLVWVYEGYLFQEGTFLRHELSKILNKENIKFVILGACGDQILFPPQGLRKIIKDYPNIRYFLEFIIRRHVTKEQILRKRISKTTKHLQFDMDIDMVLKIHGIMLNNYGIEGIYPYINQNTEHLSRRLGWLNYKKRYYKKKVKEILPENVIKHLSKSSNVVDTNSYFHLNSILLNKVLNSEVIGQILTESQINKIKREPKEYHMLVLQILYIYLFNELIVSGKYDNSFNKDFLNLTIEDIVYAEKEKQKFAITS